MKSIANRRSWGVLTAFAATFSLAGPGLPKGQNPAVLCDKAAEYAADRSQVPIQVLLAITRVETGRPSEGQVLPWPWAINLAGKGHWFSDASEAISFADSQLSEGEENFDVGCFQINLRWHGAQFASLEEVFDPQANAIYAAGFLTELYETEGSWPDAVAAYHSRTPEKAAAYLQKIEAVLADLMSAVPPGTLVAPVTEARENGFPLLQKGISRGTASLVPLLQSATALIGTR